MRRRQLKIARPGLTLVELLVVLAILALLATVAITSTDVLMGQGRYEATVRTLTNIEEAVLGPSGVRQPDGTLLVSGFVADMGRLPVATSIDPRLALSQLWAPVALPVFGIRPASDPEVLVPCGWRGPYLRLPIGTADIRDGWGNPLVLLDGDGNIATTGAAIHRLRSLGADNAIDGVGYDADLEVRLADNLQIVVSGHVYEFVSGQRQKPTLANVTVKLYGFNSATGAVSEETLTLVDAAQSVTFSHTTIAGPRFLRAYLTGSPGKKSNIVRVQRSDVFELDLVP